MIEIVSQTAGVSIATASQVVSGLFSEVERTLVGGGEVRLPNVGILRVKPMAARIARNPKTGEKVSVPPSKKVKLVVAAQLKRAVNA